MILPRMAGHMLSSVAPNCLWKFGWNFGVKGLIAVEKFKARRRRGVVFPPFLHLSVINSCNLKCQGCWVDVQAPRTMVPFEELDAIVRDAKAHGNVFFGLLGGEPFLHPRLLDLLEAHPDCYFQIFTNGQLITDKTAARLREIGNANASDPVLSEFRNATALTVGESNANAESTSFQIKVPNPIGAADEAQVANKMLLLARTKPVEQCKGTEGLSLFYTDLDRRHIDVREIPKMGRSAVDSNELFIDKLPVPVADRIGEEGRGFEYILHGMNPERILIGAEGIGLGQAALRKAAAYAGERVVFDRPIGQNQAIQHPLAACWMQLQAAELMAYKAAALYDTGKPCALEANATKYLGGEAAFKACETAVMTHGNARVPPISAQPAQHRNPVRS